MGGRYKYLNLQDRREIEEMRNSGERVEVIAKRKGVHVATIYNELRRGETGELDAAKRKIYSAELAQQRIQENLRKRGRKKNAAS